MTKITSLILVNLVTPKARAKHEPIHNKLALGLRPKVSLLNETSVLALTIGVTKFIIVKDMISVTLGCAT